MVGSGHDAHTLGALDPVQKARLGALAYFGPGVRRLRSPGHQLEVALDGGPAEAVVAWSVLAVSAARIPGGEVVPGARLDDGLLHVALVTPRHGLDWGRVALAGVGRRRRDSAALRFRSGRSVVVRSSTPGPVQVDGDVVDGVSSWSATIEPGALVVAQPRPRWWRRR